VLQKTVPRLYDALSFRQRTSGLPQAKLLALLISVMLLATACSSSATPSYLPQPEPVVIPLTTPSEFPPFEGISKGQRLRFEHISIEQGLSQSTVFCMLQDSQGYMWFGTEDGLNRYDGYNFTVYKYDPENPNSFNGIWITSIYEDRSGVIWIGTRNSGLVRFDRDSETFTSFQNDPQTPHSLSHNQVTAILEDQAGVLWIGTPHGLNRFDRENGQFIQYQQDPNDPHSSSSNAVSSIYQDREGVLWIGTEGGGLGRYDQENEAFIQYQNDPGDPHSLNDNNVRVIYQDLSGILWIGTDGGLSSFDRENDGFIHYQHDSDDPESLSSNQVRSIYQDREGALWIGTWGGGLDSLDRETETFIHFRHDPGDPHSISSDIIASIYQDREGVLWVGTVAGGLNKLDIGWRNFGLYQHNPNDPNSLGSNLIRTFYEDRSGTLWIGATATGLDRFDRATGRWHHYEHDPDDLDSLSDNWVTCLYQDQSGVLWVGTNNGLDSFDPATEVFTHYQSDSTSPDEKTIRIIYQDRSGILWIGARSGGLNRFDPESGHWRNYRHDPNDPESLSDNWVSAIYQDRSGALWLGTGGGLDRLDGESEIAIRDGTFTHYRADPNDAQSLVHNFVTEVYEDREGVLWVGTADGLDRLVPSAGSGQALSKVEGSDRATGTFDHYRIQDGLPNNVIYEILEDEQGYLWLSTNKGLSKFDPRSGIFKNYDVTDGLQENEFNGGASYKSSSGEMFFGGIAGFNAFYPDRVQDNSYIPPVVLTYLAHDGEEVDLGIAVDSATEVTFRWPDNSFKFEFAALSYARPEKNQYAYALEGFDEGWNEIGTRRYGKYTNLPGGAYTLRIKGSNNDGVWNETGVSVTITVARPFWGTWWFRGIILLVLVGGVIGGYRMRVRSVEARSRELETQVEQHTAELMKTQEALRQSELEKAITEERSRLARELHDSVTQSLHSSTLLAEAGQRLAGSGDIERARRYLIRLGEISQQALKEMRLLVYELRPLALRGVGLVGALQQRLDAVERRSGVEVQLSIEEALELPRSIEEELFRIAMEALNNALKHANPTTVTVAIRKEEKREIPCIELSIIDDGVGFDPDMKDDEGGLGLVSMKERIEKLGGELAILSAPGEGTQVKACVNLKTSQNFPNAQEV